MCQGMGARGHEVAGLAMRLPQALKLAATTPLDVAILDVTPDGRMSLPVADVLKARGVAFIFAAGHGSAGLDDSYRGVAPVVKKPFRLRDLQSAIDAAV